MLKEKNEKTYFWGKITGEENDYFIAMGVNFKNHYEFPEKKILLLHKQIRIFTFARNI
jgi:hypothetical protein